jgi:hypothetical protein
MSSDDKYEKLQRALDMVEDVRTFLRESKLLDELNDEITSLRDAICEELYTLEWESDEQA